MLVTSIFSFSYNVFSYSQNNFQIFIHVYFVVCKIFNAFNLDWLEDLLFGKYM